LQGARGDLSQPRRAAAGTGIFRGVSGAADGRRRWWRKHALEHLHAEISRGAKVSDGLDNTYIGYALIVNKNFWEGLPADIRGQLESAVKDATAYCNSIAETENSDALAKIKASGTVEFYTLSPQEKAEWRKGLLKVHEEMAPRIGKDLIQAIYK